jgi:hypothetical protein
MGSLGVAATGGIEGKPEKEFISKPEFCNLLDDERELKQFHFTVSNCSNKRHITTATEVNHIVTRGSKIFLGGDLFPTHDYNFSENQYDSKRERKREREREVSVENRVRLTGYDV